MNHKITYVLCAVEECKCSWLKVDIVILLLALDSHEGIVIDYVLGYRQTEPSTYCEEASPQVLCLSSVIHVRLSLTAESPCNTIDLTHETGFIHWNLITGNPTDLRIVQVLEKNVKCAAARNMIRVHVYQRVAGKRLEQLIQGTYLSFPLRVANQLHSVVLDRPLRNNRHSAIGTTARDDQYFDEAPAGEWLVKEILD